MTVRRMSVQSQKIFVAYWPLETAILKIFNGISLDLSSPKAEVTSSNLVGRAT
jgi:hypothetical protein